MAQIAAQRGLNPDELVQQVLSRYMEDDRHFVEAVNLGLVAAERGEFAEHEEVGKLLKKSCGLDALQISSAAFLARALRSNILI